MGRRVANNPTRSFKTGSDAPSTLQRLQKFVMAEFVCQVSTTVKDHSNSHANVSRTSEGTDDEEYGVFESITRLFGLEHTPPTKSGDQIAWGVDAGIWKQMQCNHIPVRRNTKRRNREEAIRIVQVDSKAVPARLLEATNWQPIFHGCRHSQPQRVVMKECSALLTGESARAAGHCKPSHCARLITHTLTSPSRVAAIDRQ